MDEREKEEKKKEDMKGKKKNEKKEMEMKKEKEKEKECSVGIYRSVFYGYTHYATVLSRLNTYSLTQIIITINFNHSL